MADKSRPDDSLDVRVRNSFESARAATLGIWKVALLWAAVTVAVWISGLEPIKNKVVGNAGAFSRINADWQKAQRQAMIILRDITNQEKTIISLEEFASKYNDNKKYEEEFKLLSEKERDAFSKLILELKPHIKQFLSEHKEFSETFGMDYLDPEEKMKLLFRNIFPSSTSIPEKLQDLFIVWQKATGESRRLRNMKDAFDAKPLADRKAALEERRKSLREVPEHLDQARKITKEQAAAQQREVTFEFAKLKFSFSPLLTGLFCCISCAGLLGYLGRARSKSIANCIQGFTGLAQSPYISCEKLIDLTGRLPAWSARDSLRTYAAALNTEKGLTALDREPLVSFIFGSRVERQLASSLDLVLPFVLLVSELRLVSITLELSRYSGSTLARSMLPLVMLLVIASSFWGWAWWLFDDRVSLLFQSWAKGLFAGLIGALVVATTIFALNPRAGIAFGLLLQKSMLWIAIACFGLLILNLLMQMYLPAVHDGLATIVNRCTRRQFILVSGGLIVLLGLNKSRSLFFIHHSKGKRKQKQREPFRRELKQGFYTKRQSKRGGDGENGNPAISPASVVLHYVGTKGRILRNGTFPRSETLNQVKPLMFFRGDLAELLGVKQEQAPANPFLRDSAEPEGEEQASANPLMGDAAEHDDVKVMSGESNAAVNPEPPLYAPGKKGLPIERVHLAVASWSYEEAALVELRKMRHRLRRDRKKSKAVCDLLISGIRHDILFKHRCKRLRPSFRLYDLLAGVSVRFEQKHQFDEMIDIIREYDLEFLFDSRIKKWKSTDSPWRKRWENRQFLVTWKGSSGAVVF